MVVTNDPLLYERAVRMHDLGQLRPHHRQILSPREPAFCGSQFRMTELSAAVALAQSRKLGRVRSHCRKLQRRIMARIVKLPGLTFRRIPDPSGDSGFEIYFWLKTKQSADEFAAALAEWNVRANRTTGTTFHYLRDYCRLGRAHAAGSSPFARFRKWPARGYRPGDFPRTESLMSRFLALPLGVLHTAEDADYIADVICRVHGQLRIEK